MAGEGSSLLGEHSNCPFYSRIRHEDVLLKLLHSSGWREIPGITKSVEVLCKSSPVSPLLTRASFRPGERMPL